MNRALVVIVLIVLVVGVLVGVQMVNMPDGAGLGEAFIRMIQGPMEMMGKAAEGLFEMPARAFGGIGQ